MSPSGTTATDTIDSKVMFPSVHDAVISAVRSRDFAVCSRYLVVYFTLVLFLESSILP